MRCCANLTSYLKHNSWLKYHSIYFKLAWDFKTSLSLSKFHKIPFLKSHPLGPKKSNKVVSDLMWPRTVRYWFDRCQESEGLSVLPKTGRPRDPPKKLNWKILSIVKFSETWRRTILPKLWRRPTWTLTPDLLVLGCVRAMEVMDHLWLSPCSRWRRS